MAAPAPDHPFALWRVFQDAPRWWFARGCPPPLRDERWWVRLMRMAALLGPMGFVVGALFGATMFFEQYFDLPTISYRVAGVAFGAIVLLPLSRWAGRGWLHSALAILFAAPLFEVFDHWLSAEIELRVELDYSDYLIANAIAAACMAFAASLWMCGRRWRCGFGVACLGALLAATGSISVLEASIQAHSFVVVHLRSSTFQMLGYLFNGMLFFGFHVALLAMAVGLRFVWCNDCRPTCDSPQEAALP